MSNIAPSTSPLPPDDSVSLGALFLILLFLLFLPFLAHLFAYKQGCFNEYFVCVKEKTVEFSGRSRRKEYIGFVVANWLLSYDALLIDYQFGTVFTDDGHIGAFWLLYSFVIFVPYVAVTIRRLHDTGRNWTWIFVALIPYLGYIILTAILFFFDSEVGPNAYGPNPKNVVFDTVAVATEYEPVQDNEFGNHALSTTGGESSLLTSLTESSALQKPLDSEDDRTTLV